MTRPMRLNPRPAPSLPTREAYLRLLGWAFAFFGSVRVLSYLPTMFTIWQQGSSSR
jgi:hypothetical protein